MVSPLYYLDWGGGILDLGRASPSATQIIGRAKWGSAIRNGIPYALFRNVGDAFLRSILLAGGVWGAYRMGSFLLFQGANLRRIQRSRPPNPPPL